MLAAKDSDEDEYWKMRRGRWMSDVVSVFVYVCIYVCIYACVSNKSSPWRLMRIKSFIFVV